MDWLHNSLKHFFIPHQHNDHKPHFLRAGILSLFILVVLVSQVGTLYSAFQAINVRSFLASVLPSVLTDMTNQTRAAENLSTLTENPLLVEAARLKAQDMALKGYFAHVTPDGKTPWYWLDTAGYKYGYAGENLAVNYSESKDVLDAWMNSPTHRANIEKSNYTEIGIATAEGYYKGVTATFVVQYFASPREALATEKAVVAAPPKKTVPKKQPGEVKAAEVKNKPAESKPQTVALAPTPGSVPLAVSAPQAQPQNVLGQRNASKMVLEFSLALVAAALILALILKTRTKHPRLVLNAFVGLLILSSLYIAEGQLAQTGVKLPASDASASIALNN